MLPGLDGRLVFVGVKQHNTGSIRAGGIVRTLITITLL